MRKPFPLTQLRSDDEGSVLILVIFSSVLSLALILGVMAATSLYIERKRLFALADGAATAAAEAFTLDSVSLAGGRPRITLMNEQVLTEAADYLNHATVTGSIPPTLVTAESVDARSASVTLAGAWRPPVVSLFFPEGLDIRVTATARTVFG